MGSGASKQRKAELSSALADIYARAAEDVARSEHTEAVVPNASAPPESSPSAADAASSSAEKRLGIVERLLKTAAVPVVVAHFVYPRSTCPWVATSGP